MKQTRAQQQRQRWMRAFEVAVLATHPHLAGKIEWDDAAYMFLTGVVANDAAARYTANR